MTPRLARLQALGEWADRFSTPEFTMGRWAGGERGPDGVIQMPWFDYSPAAQAFIQQVYDLEWVMPFDWGQWAATDRALRLLSDPSSIETATAEELADLLTTIVRGDRFSEGELAQAHEAGILPAIVRRAGILAGAEGGAKDDGMRCR